MRRDKFYCGLAFLLIFLISSSISSYSQTPPTGWLFRGVMLKNVSLPGEIKIKIPSDIPITDTTLYFADFIKGGKGLYMPFVPEDADGGFADILLSYLAF
ncbi:MAG TPA: hypothetical protein PLB62_14130, partial [Candidatus Sumerlaeota bacterium]|nr:hypothetical protein [Candidatus Sumerlaeota bacterium]